jgi:hypothetical protein
MEKKKQTERKIHVLIAKQDNILDSHLELRTITQITDNYNLTLVTLVRITQKFVDMPKSLKTETEEDEIYRMGFEDTEKATELHKQIVDVITDLNNHKLLSIPFK